MRKRVFKRRTRRGLVVLAVLVAAFILPAAGALAAPPANDDFDSAVGITDLPYTNVVLTNEATSDATDPNCFGGARTVWYSLNAAEDARISVDTLESNYDTTVGIYTGAEGALTDVACNDNFGYGKKSLVRFDVHPGTTYHIMVGSLTTRAKGTLRLNVTTAPPRAPNDDEPTVVSSLPFSETVDVTEATANSTDPECHESSHTVWYSYTSARDTRIEVDTSGSNWDTVVGVYQGADLTRILCTDYPVARFNAKASKTYWMMIGSWYGGPALDLVLTIDEAPPPLRVDARIAGKGRIAKMTGAARLAVGVRCTDDATAYASGRVKQRQGDRIVTASFSRRIGCGTRWADARITAVPKDRVFRAGKAVVNLKVSAYTNEEWDRTSTKKVVRFR
jgi:hypothetical protein